MANNGHYQRPTDKQLLNEFPETKIDDINKLDPEKRNCVICLEDFKSGEKATLLLLKELLLGKADLCSDATVLESGGISYPLHPFLI